MSARWVGPEGQRVLELKMWQCPICHRTYNEYESALKCVAIGFNPTLKVGDFVYVQKGYGWFDGDEDWVVKDGGYEFHGRPTHKFIFVVTDITTKDDDISHRVQYHLRSGALKIGDDGDDYGGFNYDEHHLRMQKLDDNQIPDSLLLKADKFVAKGKTRNLL